MNIEHWTNYVSYYINTFVNNTVSSHADMCPSHSRWEVGLIIAMVVSFDCNQTQIATKIKVIAKRTYICVLCVYLRILNCVQLRGLSWKLSHHSTFWNFCEWNFCTMCMTLWCAWIYMMCSLFSLGCQPNRMFYFIWKHAN